MKTPRKTKYFFGQDDILRRQLAKEEVNLFLDYDGTLAQISETPDRARLSPEMKDVLAGLSRLPGCHLAVISGRTLADLKQMMDIPGITYVGTHGFEIEGTHLNFESMISDQYLADLSGIKEQLLSKLSAIEGIWLEDKVIMITLHYRQAGEKGEYLAQEICKNVCQSFTDQQRIKIIEGKKILEIRPPLKWDKGEAALWILSKWRQEIDKNQVVTFYVGDDNTDEDAFRLLDHTAVKIRVGESDRSFAEYHLKDQPEVLVLLNKIFDIKNKPD